MTDLAVEVVRDLVTETQTRLAGVQKDVTARVADVQKTAADPKALRDRPPPSSTPASTPSPRTPRPAARPSRPAWPSSRPRPRPTPAKVQTLVDDNVTAATDTYTDLVKRGESLVGRIRRQESTKATVTSAKTTVAKAKTTTTQAKKAVDAETTATKKTVTAARPLRRRAPKTGHQDRGQEGPGPQGCRQEDRHGPERAKATVTAAKNDRHQRDPGRHRRRREGRRLKRRCRSGPTTTSWL